MGSRRNENGRINYLTMIPPLRPPGFTRWAIQEAQDQGQDQAANVIWWCFKKSTGAREQDHSVALRVAVPGRPFGQRMHTDERAAPIVCLPSLRRTTPLFRTVLN
ncbi:uncharacterized protein [Dermacentor andersoni]|uniref:uncharacterized protein n=1 Tax=Dermacentor andersoni TaxID=34620 RepID=UPI003B3AABE4